MVAVDVGLGSGKKNEKKGFKVDRYERYQAKRRGEVLPSKKEANRKKNLQTATKEVRFDESARHEFLTGFHKRKNERRVKAFTDAKKKIAKENQKMRQEQREEARRAYNNFAKVPILPDYSYQLPNYVGSIADEGDDETRDEEGGNLDDREKEESNSSFAAVMQSRKQRERTVMQPEERFGDDQDVVVHVQPLFGRPNAAAAPSSSSSGSTSKCNNKKQAAVKGSLDDFSDLPEAVAAELKRLRMTEKGPARTKARQNTLKQLEKIRTIRKHSKKGHGKKGAKKKGR